MSLQGLSKIGLAVLLGEDSHFFLHYHLVKGFLCKKNSLILFIFFSSSLSLKNNKISFVMYLARMAEDEFEFHAQHRRVKHDGRS